jgi:hypothetical protein
MLLRSPDVFELGAERRDEFGAFLGLPDAGQNLTRVVLSGEGSRGSFLNNLLVSDANYRGISYGEFMTALRQTWVGAE